MSDLIHRIAWILSIVSILVLSVFGRPWQQAITRLLNERMLFWLLIAVLGLLVLVGLVYITSVAASAKRRPGLWLVCGLLVLLAMIVPGRPEEVLHFITFGLYGFLSALLFAWIPLVLLCVGLAMGDELLQWWLPNRVGDWNDVSMNLLASGGGALLAWLGTRKS